MPARRAFGCVVFALLAMSTLTCGNGAALSQNAADVRAPALSFTNTPLLQPGGSSEPAISISASSTMALSGLSWTQFFTNVWKGPFGSTPAFQGQIDADIGKSVGGGDADIEIGSTGTLHATT